MFNRKPSTKSVWRAIRTLTPSLFSFPDAVATTPAVFVAFAPVAVAGWLSVVNEDFAHTASKARGISGVTTNEV
jgi:hypothetical protein